MKIQKNIYFALLIAVIGNFDSSVNADNGHIKTQEENRDNELIKKLPTALLENLHRDLQEQEEKSNKNIDSIAGITKNKLEAEITARHNEDKSQTVGTRKIDPKLLPGDLLNYIAKQGISYNGCTPQDAINEIRDRSSEVVDDFPEALGVQIQDEYIKKQQEEAGETFAERENAEDLQTTIEEVKETTEQGKDPALEKQAEYIKQQKENSGDHVDDALKGVAEGENVETPPHGFDEKRQNERTSEEINEAKNIVEERKLINTKPEEKSFFTEIWNGIVKHFNSWFGRND